ncbi:MAG: PHB depolymerase family esterase [Pseudomonadota bacterium]
MMALKILGAAVLVVIAVLGVVIIGFIRGLKQTRRPALASCTPGAPKSCDGTFIGPDLDLDYRLLYPGDASGSNAAPAAMFVMLHGAGLNGRYQDYLSQGSLQALATQENIIILLPSASGKHNTWLDNEHPDHPDVKVATDQAPALFALIDHYTAQFGIDRANVAIAGYSNGGTMAMRLAGEAEVPFAALGAFGSPTTRHQIEHGSQNTVPVMLFHGTKDSANRFEGGYSKFLGMDIKLGGAVPVLSAQETVDFWRRTNGAMGAPEPQDILINASDGTSTRTYTYPDDARQSPVVQVVIENGGHFVPGSRRFPWALMLLQRGQHITAFDGYAMFWAFAKGFMKTREDKPQGQMEAAQ